MGFELWETSSVLITTFKPSHSWPGSEQEVGGGAEQQGFPDKASTLRVPSRMLRRLMKRGDASKEKTRGAGSPSLFCPRVVEPAEVSG